MNVKNIELKSTEVFPIYVDIRRKRSMYNINKEWGFFGTLKLTFKMNDKTAENLFNEAISIVETHLGKEPKIYLDLKYKQVTDSFDTAEQLLNSPTGRYIVNDMGRFRGTLNKKLERAIKLMNPPPAT